jgi:hypothetical protein
MARARWLIAVCALAGAIALPALASGTARRVVGNCTSSQVRPATIVVACADANLQLTHLKWSSFGGSTARATGEYYVNDCAPNCAAGKFHSYPITVVLSKAKLCKDHYDDYQQAAVRFAATRPKLAQTKLSLFCPLPG